jgi:hypothetical protein
MAFVSALLQRLRPSTLPERERLRWAEIDPHPSAAYAWTARRSRTDRDLARQPDVIWSSAPYWAPRDGLRAHLEHIADRVGGVPSDAIVVLHPESWEATRRSLVRDWDRALCTVLAECWERLVTEHGLRKLSPSRPFRVEVRCDGDPRLGASMNLGPAEFGTILSPNLYLGPGPGSEAVAEVFVRERGGFRSIGTFWNDQVAFHVGAHALDNGRCPELLDSALYALVRRGPDDPLSHRVHPAVLDRVRVDVGESTLGQTVRLVDAGRGVLLSELAIVPARSPNWELPATGERAGVVVGGVGPDLPNLGPAPAGATLLPGEGLPGGPISIVPDTLPVRGLVLSERAVLLQRVHFRKQMVGYDLDLDRGGRLGPRVTDPVARLEVRDDRVSLLALCRDLCLDGTPLREGQRVSVGTGEHQGRWRGGEARLQGVMRPDPKWPYLLRVELPRRSHPLPAGRPCVVGRDRKEADVALPDRPTPENIRWRDGQATGPLDLPGGAVDRGTFRTDAIFVASRAAVLVAEGTGLRLTNPSQSCPVHVLPAQGECVRVGSGGEAPVAVGDEIWVGNQVFALLPEGQADPLPAADREEDAPPMTEVMERPASGRLERGPGAKGRRPVAGGKAGALVRHERTLGQVLAQLPHTQVAQLGPPRAWPPREALRTRVEEDGPSPQGPATAALPSISLDPATGGGGPPPTRAEGRDPARAVAADSESARNVTPAKKPQSSLPRGLQICPAAEGSPPLGRHARGALPGFAPRPRS